ncbi:hypothetical protein Lfu02_22630 [Longispora fulva]|uniref:Uncharacterized protein n=1 Tax=Longispora fulva TaxID=619741 RepID=A0A8J7KIV3_9ACTN|nr:hypothetical protein [Longispora fulva]MBG6139725.1 hypothetical protein [Longispora fulva]GIG57891.1 hypothetical protein Lfu02_22630 [Longispora fulva]
MVAEADLTGGTTGPPDADDALAEAGEAVDPPGVCGPLEGADLSDVATGSPEEDAPPTDVVLTGGCTGPGWVPEPLAADVDLTGGTTAAPTAGADPPDVSAAGADPPVPPEVSTTWADPAIAAVPPEASAPPELFDPADLSDPSGPRSVSKSAPDNAAPSTIGSIVVSSLEFSGRSDVTG